MKPEDFYVRTVGPCRIPSPVESNYFVEDGAGILLDPRVFPGGAPLEGRIVLEAAGPRRHICFSPAQVRAAIVSCGGLCPGINDVIRAITMVLWFRYGVRQVLGLRYGYEGLVASIGHKPIPLTPDVVADIHQHGGTILGSSRGPQSVPAMVDFLQSEGINMLFTIGGDGTQRGALEIVKECIKRGLQIAVVGVPKTIDNDIAFTDRTFGFETAVAMSQAPIDGAHMEAKGVRNGVGLVKLMGRESGFVAAYASLASSNVNLVLVPEVRFSLHRVLEFLEGRLAAKAHAVIVVAEGAGQDLVPTEGVDASGNRKFGDVGLFLRRSITEHFQRIGRPAAVRYIDPSYLIRSAPASADDSVFCFQLGENAVHAAMAGRTGTIISLWNSYFVHVPMAVAVAQRKRIDPRGSLWQSVLDNTGQPADLN
ncbi:MAG: ATP-dependent 6-phosphofructokinase [Kiritimatiellia bacterium]